jgi:hypothetical protein
LVRVNPVLLGGEGEILAMLYTHAGERVLERRTITPGMSALFSEQQQQQQQQQ